MYTLSVYKSSPFHHFQIPLDVDAMLHQDLLISVITRSWNTSFSRFLEEGFFLHISITGNKELSNWTIKVTCDKRFFLWQATSVNLRVFRVGSEYCRTHMAHSAGKVSRENINWNMNINEKGRKGGVWGAWTLKASCSLQKFDNSYLKFVYENLSHTNIR